jgi:murein DD-endopeptidase MepM/ murein hydrolase activator NlpD
MKMKNKVILLAFLSFFFFSPSHATPAMQNSNGFYYPVGKKHSGEYLGFGSKNFYYGNSCHLANDYKADVETPVYAIGFGVVENVSTNVGNYGGDTPPRPGGAIIIKHFTKTGDSFYALYGHVNSVVEVGNVVKGGEIIGVIHSYYSQYTDIPHLHFGINNDFPSYIGYTPSPQCKNTMGFVDPEVFLDLHEPFDMNSFKSEVKIFLEKSVLYKASVSLIKRL